MTDIVDTLLESSDEPWNPMVQAACEIELMREAIFDWARDINAAEGVLFLKGSKWEPMIMEILEAEAARRGGWEGWV
jgi:hypothetical protein